MADWADETAADAEDFIEAADGGTLEGFDAKAYAVYLRGRCVSRATVEDFITDLESDAEGADMPEFKVYLDVAAAMRKRLLKGPKP